MNNIKINMILKWYLYYREHIKVTWTEIVIIH